MATLQCNEAAVLVDVDAAKDVQSSEHCSPDVSNEAAITTNLDAAKDVSASGHSFPDVRNPVASGNRPLDCNKEAIVTVNIHGAKELLASGHRLLDVRTKEEFSKGYVEGTMNVPFLFFTPQGREKNPSFLEEVSAICSKNDHILVSCQTGNRGLMASTALLNAGFKNVINMGGGLDAWLENGFQMKLPEDGTRT